MTTKERLEHLHTLVSTTEFSPDASLRALSVKVMDRELDLLVAETRRQDFNDMTDAEYESK
jgi:hypothetical protein